MEIEIINRAIKICEDEKYMRKIVFKNNPKKQISKMGEMRFVISVLNQIKDELNLKEKNLFE